ADVGDRHAAMDSHPCSLAPLLELSERHERDGLGDAPWPPHYEKQPGEPARVQPSRRRTPKHPLIEIGRAQRKDDALAGLERCPCIWSYLTARTRSIRSCSHDRSFPALHRLCPPGMRVISLPSASAHSRHGWFSSACSRSGASSSASCLRIAIVNDEVTPTWCSAPWSSYRPSNNEPTSTSFPVLCHRNPAATQSAVRACFTLIMARL